MVKLFFNQNCLTKAKTNLDNHFNLMNPELNSGRVQTIFLIIIFNKQHYGTH